jgi:hypothetical protein
MQSLCSGAHQGPSVWRCCCSNPPLAPSYTQGGQPGVAGCGICTQPTHSVMKSHSPRAANDLITAAPSDQTPKSPRRPCQQTASYTFHLSTMSVLATQPASSNTAAGCNPYAPLTAAARQCLPRYPHVLPQHASEQTACPNLPAMPTAIKQVSGSQAQATCSYGVRLSLYHGLLPLPEHVTGMCIRHATRPLAVRGQQ